MVVSQLIRISEGRFSLGGVLDFDTVPVILRESAPQFSGLRDVVVDLAEVSKANSAGMALLLEWRAKAQLNQTTVRFANLPDSIQKIAQVCDVEGLLAD